MAVHSPPNPRKPEVTIAFSDYCDPLPGKGLLVFWTQP